MGRMLDKDRKTNTYTNLLTTYVAVSRNGSRNNITFFLEHCNSSANFKGWRRFNSVLKFHTIDVWHNRHTNKSKVLHVSQCLIAYDFLDVYSIRNKTPYLIIRHFWRAHLQLLLQTVSYSITNTVFLLEIKLFYGVLRNNHYGCIKHLSWLAFVA
jgi:hypothetical protein